MAGGVLSKIMPARQKAHVNVVADIDQLLSESVAFVWKGKEYIIDPVTTEQFMRMASELGKIQDLITRHSKEGGATQDEIYNAYHQYISVLCPSFSYEDLKKMPIQGVHAVLNLIVKHATGQPMNMDAAGEKKKTMRA